MLQTHSRSRHLRLAPFAIILAFYVVLLSFPGHALASSPCAQQFGAIACRGVETGPESYEVCDINYGCGLGSTEAAAITSYEELLASSLGVSACSSSYVDETPGWQPPGIGVGSASNYPGDPGPTPSYSLAWEFSAETHQLQNPLVFTFHNGTGCTHTGTIYAFVQRTRDMWCPSGYYANTSTPSDAFCYTPGGNVEPPKNFGGMCPAATQAGGNSLGSSPTSVGTGGCLGDPVNPATHNNVQAEVDYIGSGPMPLGFVRYYNSLLWNGTSAPDRTTFSGFGFWSTLGPNWRSSYDRFISFDSAAEYATADVFRPDGKSYAFVQQPGGQFVPEPDIADRLVQLTNGSGTLTGWQLTNAANDEVETYNASGQLISLTSRSGLTQTLSYNSSNQLVTVTDAFGRTLSFAYDSTGRLSTLTDPAGGVYTYSYTSVNDVASVTYPDNSVRTYVYNEQANTNNQNEPYILTGVVDENSNRFATFQYNNQVQLTAVNHAGVEQYSLTYASEYQSAVTDPLGASRTFLFQTWKGALRTSSVSSTCLTDCAGFASATTYDANANVASTKDYNGNLTNYSYDLTRDLETSRTEAYGSAQPRTITTSWNSSFRLPTLISLYAGNTASGTPVKTTGFSYDGSGNLLTRTVTDTTVTPNVSRIWTYTYDSYGRVLTAQGPRTDVNSTTAYSYYTCTSGYQCGELQTVTDPVGNVTTYNTYNAHGKPLTITDPNGVVTTLTYDARTRLTSRQVGTETTTFSYYPTGLLKQVTLPDNSFVLYTYDNAHRLIEISDGAGNSIQYTLDNMGNRTTEKTYDPSSILHRTHSRAFNTLNELYQDINAAGTSAVTTTYAYDSNGNQTAIDAPLTRNTANTYDALNRVSLITDPNSGKTYFGYDVQDDLTSVKDPRSLTTSYTYNGFGDVTTLMSPDTGTTANTYDSGGNLSTSTDARGAVSSYSYDAANRVTSIVYSLGGSSDQTITFGYDSGTDGKGRLTSASDANHSLAWTYDFAGRVVGKGLTVGTVNLSVGYAYTNADLTALVTPSGQSVAYGFDSNHQIASITVNGSTVLSGVTYEPFGGVNGWTWGDGSTVSRSFNGDGLVSQIVTAGVTFGYSFDNANRITGISDSSNSALTWAYGYDVLDRLTNATTTAITDGWTYDANGNQLTQTGSTPNTFSVSSTNNQLTGITGTLTRSYSYDAAGHTTSYGSLGFTYNDRGRMEAANSTDYLYNALGQMIEKSGSAGTTVFMQDESGHLLGEYSASGALLEETIWLGDIPVATLQPNGSGGVNIFYVHSDHLNAPRKVTQPTTGTLAWRWDTDPFGTAAPNQNPAGLGTFPYNLRFPGQYYDSETGLNQNWNRDYDPIVGRYVESDLIGLRGGLNTYRYAASRPTMATDFTGLVLRAPGWSDPDWKQIQAAEQQIRNELSKACSCPRDGVESCIPCDPTLLSNLRAALDTSTVYPGDEECGSAPVGAKWLKLTPKAFTSPGCACLAVSLYHELLHDAGLSHYGPAGDVVSDLDRKCRGNLCGSSEPVIIGIQ